MRCSISLLIALIIALTFIIVIDVNQIYDQQRYTKGKLINELKDDDLIGGEY